MRAANSAAQVSTAWYTGRTPRPQRISRMTVSVVPRSSAICASEKPFCLAVGSVPASRAGASPTCSATWLMCWICSMNQGSMPVARGDIGRLAPARSAWWMVASRPSCGVRAVTEQARRVPGRVLPAERAMVTLHRPQGLLQGLGEAPADGHRLADALHVRGERGVGPGELLEREPRHLDHHVVQRGLEAGRGLAGDVVRDLVEGVPDGQPGRDLGDREAGGLGGERDCCARRAGSSRSRPSGRCAARPRTGCCSRRCPPRPRA